MRAVVARIDRRSRARSSIPASAAGSCAVRRGIAPSAPSVRRTSGETMTPRPWIAVPPALLGLLAAMVAAPVAQAAHEAARAPAATVSWAVDLPAALSAARAEQRLVLVCFN